MRQQLVGGKLTIPKGKRESSGLKLRADAAVLTIYAPRLDGQSLAAVEVSADEQNYLPYYHKGAAVQLAPSSATDVPIPACKSLRVTILADQTEERVFHVLELLEM